MTQQMQKSKGFTLIELMLVIAIIAAMTVFGISAWQQKVMMAKVDKTALQMQMIMQAAVAYNVQNGAWPSSDKEPDGVKNLIDSHYIPKSLLYDPWGAPYAAKLYTTKDGTPVDANYIVTTTIPDDINYRKSIAKLIAGKLPVTGDPKRVKDGQVVAIVNVPPQSPFRNLKGNDQIIVGAEEVKVNEPDGASNGVKIRHYSCPKGWQKKVLTAIGGFQVMSQPNNEKLSHWAYLYNAKSSSTVDNNKGAVVLSAESQIYNHGKGDWGVYPLVHKGTVLAITTCTKPKKSNQLTKKEGNFIF